MHGLAIYDNWPTLMRQIDRDTFDQRENDRCLIPIQLSILAKRGKIVGDADFGDTL